MRVTIDDRTRDFISGHRVARLATADGDGRPSVVPVCYALEGQNVYSAIDEKPKSVAPRRLKRVRNIETNPHVSLVIDDYSEDWSKLAFVVVSGWAKIISPLGEAVEHARAVELLRDKYPQYHAMAIDDGLIVKITITRIKRWGAR